MNSLLTYGLNKKKIGIKGSSNEAFSKRPWPGSSVKEHKNDKHVKLTRQ